MPQSSSDQLQLEELICFALHSANSAMNRSYQPHLSKIGLTYPQYIALAALWHRDGVTVGTLCDTLRTGTNTLTPLLKRLEKLGHIRRERSDEDERRVYVFLTEQGAALESEMPGITNCIVSDTGMSMEMLHDLVGKIQELRDNLEQSSK